MPTRLLLILGLAAALSTLGCAAAERERYLQHRSATYVYPLSVDELLERAAASLRARGWTVTRGEGALDTGWRSEKGKSFRLRVETNPLGARLTRARVLRVGHENERGERTLEEEARLLFDLSPSLRPSLTAERETAAPRFLGSVLAPSSEVPSHALLARHLPLDTCGPSIDGFLNGMARESTVLVPDVVGTREVTDALTRLACHGAAAGREVVLALPLAASLGPALAVYARSAGSAADQEALRQAARAEDAALSTAQVEDVERLRRWRQLGLALDLAAYRGPEHAATQQLLLARRAESPNAWMLVLLEDARDTHPNAAAGDVVLPLGAALAQAGWNVLPLATDTVGGAAYRCEDGRCGAREIPGTAAARSPASVASQWDSPTRLDPHDPAPGSQLERAPSLFLRERHDKEGVGGSLYVGAVTPALPANPARMVPVVAPPPLPSLAWLETCHYLVRELWPHAVRAQADETFSRLPASDEVRTDANEVDYHVGLCLDGVGAPGLDARLLETACQAWKDAPTARARALEWAQSARRQPGFAQGKTAGDRLAVMREQMQRRCEEDAEVHQLLCAVHPALSKDCVRQ